MCRMEQKIIQTKQIKDENDRIWTMRYWLLVHTAEGGEVFGAAIDQCAAEKIVERDEVLGLSERKEDAMLFLDRLCNGDAMPVELVALADDYMLEQEWKYQG